MGRHGLSTRYSGTSHYFQQVSCWRRRRQKKGSGIGTPKWDAREETVDVDLSFPPVAATFDAKAAYPARVDEEASRSAARRDGLSGEAEDPWVMDPRSGIWTMGGPRLGKAEPRPREDMQIRGLYFHSPGKSEVGRNPPRGRHRFGCWGCREARRPSGFGNSLLPIVPTLTTSSSTGKILPRKSWVRCGRMPVTSGHVALSHIVSPRS